jgi:hypothetical protein
MMNIVHDKDICDFPDGSAVDHVFHPIKGIFVNVIVARHKHLFLRWDRIYVVDLSHPNLYATPFAFSQRNSPLSRFLP